MVKLSLLCFLTSARFWSVPAADTSKSGPDTLDKGVGPEGLWHLLSPDLQHSLSGVLSTHGAESKLEDPEVNAFMSNLLHDELETQWKKKLEDEELEAKNMEKLFKAEEALKQQQAEHKHHMEELAAERKAHEAEREAARKAREEAHNKAEAEAKERHRAFEETTRKNNEFMQKAKERRAKSEQRRAEMQQRHAKNWERASSLLAQVHSELEVATDGWRDAPFWDDFFRTSSAATRFTQIGFKHIEPALTASALLPEHRVLVIEPRGASLADRLAGEIHEAKASAAEAHAYGVETDEGRDFVVEVGLLDAMAMGGAGADTSKLDALKSASARLAKIVKPGGTWISISAVPPALRVPLLARLTGGMFALPSEKEDATAGTHSVVLSARDNQTTKAGLRGSAQVADMLLYGSEDVHIWAYRMKRSEDGQPGHVEAAEYSPDGLLELIRQQHPASRDDL